MSSLIADTISMSLDADAHHLTPLAAADEFDVDAAQSDVLAAAGPPTRLQLLPVQHQQDSTRPYAAGIEQRLVGSKTVDASLNASQNGVLRLRQPFKDVDARGLLKDWHGIESLLRGAFAEVICLTMCPHMCLPISSLFVQIFLLWLFATTLIFLFPWT